MATKAKFYIATSNGWVEADFGGSGNGSFYGVCNTAAGTSAKTVTGVEDFTLETGRSINVKFANASSTGTMTLNVNNTGAKIIMGGGGLTPTWTAGSIINFVYDGAWVMQTNFAIVNGIMNVVETNSDNIVELQGGIDQMQTTMGQIQEGFVGINNRVTQLENNGAVKSVGLEAPTGFDVTNSPITTSGAIKLSFATGYSLPTTANQTNWNTAYSWGNHATKGYLTQAALNDALNNTPWVSYEEQELTTLQKTQARKNIGAGTSSFSGSYTDLTNKPTIPTKVSELTNDSGYTTNTGTVTKVDNISPSSGNVTLSAVRYASQTLTDAQKTQARTNIGAGTSNFSGSYTDLTNKPNIPTYNLVNQNTSGIAPYINDTATWSSSKTYRILASHSELGNWNEPKWIQFPFIPANTSITGATKCKITYDSKGLVTAGANLAASDIPALDVSKITSGTFEIGRIPTGTSSTTVALGNHTHNNILTTAPTSANTSGEMKFVVLSHEPNIRYSGYLYIVTS